MENLLYAWNQNFTQALVTWRGNAIAVLFVPNFTNVPNMKRAAYLFNRDGDFRRYPDEESARAFVANRIEIAESRLAAGGDRRKVERRACPAA